MAKFNISHEAVELSRQVAVLGNDRGIIGGDLFAYPESLEIRSQGSSDYSQIAAQVAKQSSEMAFIEQDDGRFVALARLAGEIVLPHFTSVNWLEIYEDEASVQIPRLHGINFYHDDLEKVSKIMRARNVGYSLSEIYVTVPVTRHQVFRFTDVPTNRWLKTEKKAKKAIRVKLSHG